MRKWMKKLKWGKWLMRFYLLSVLVLFAFLVKAAIWPDGSLGPVKWGVHCFVCACHYIAYRIYCDANDIWDSVKKDLGRSGA